MIIIIEGIDKSGKTTLIKDLYAALPAAVRVKNTIKPDGSKEISIGKIIGVYNGIYNVAGKFENPVILDRSHLTEIVYSAKRGYQALDYFDWRALERELDAIVIYMSAPKNTIKQRFIADKEDYLTVPEIDMIMTGYTDQIAKTSLPVLRLSSTDDRQTNLAEVIRFIGKHK